MKPMKRLLFSAAVLQFFAACGDDAPSPPTFDATIEADAGPDQGSEDAANVDSGSGSDADAGNADAGNADADTGTGADGGGIVYDVFMHGVASGDPLRDRVIIWTRVTPREPASNDVDVSWRVARDDAFAQIVASGTVNTSTHADFTVKVDVTGLQPGTSYWYQFEAEHEMSPVGRTKTLPTGLVQRLRFGVVSCSHFAAGYFNVYGRLADRSEGDADLDAVLHLGDYFYEYGPGQYGDAQIPSRAPLPADELITLEDYRRRHMQYKTDPDLQAMHARHPMIAIWDDHEAANNAWTDGAQNHDPATEGAWNVRKTAAIQAYHEWMPIRTAAMGGEIFRQFQFGDLMTLTMLDTRHFGRNQQLSYDDLDARDPMPFVTNLLDPSRTILGAEQEAWLERALAGPRATTWDIVGQQVMMAPFYLPQIRGLPVQDPRVDALNALGLLGEALAQQGALPGIGLYFASPELDAWDGYIAARQRLFRLFQALDNVVVLSGDFHSAWASELVQEHDLRSGTYTSTSVVGVEFLTSSVTSPGFDAVFGPLVGALTTPIKAKNPHIKYSDLEHRGFVILTVTPEEVLGEFVSVTTNDHNTQETLQKAYRVTEGHKTLVEVE